MIKNIVIAILIIISLCTTVYALYQQTEVKRQETLIFENTQKLNKCMVEAMEQRKIAEEMMAIAVATRVDVENKLKSALEKCK